MFELIRKELENAGIEVHGPRYKSVPEVDYSLFPEDIQEKIRESVIPIICYINGFMITDNYGNDQDKRNEWIFGMNEKFPGFNEWYNNSNKLVLGSTGGVSLYVDGLRRIAKENNLTGLHDACKAVSGIRKEIIGKEYGSINLPEKIAHVNRFEDGLYNLLETISVGKPAFHD